MKTKNYLLCYDISDEKRLARLSKMVEKEAYRIQNSIFLLLAPTPSELNHIIAEVTKIIDKEKDDVRIYTIKNSGYLFGIATNLDEPFILI